MGFGVRCRVGIPRAPPEGARGIFCLGSPEIESITHLKRSIYFHVCEMEFHIKKMTAHKSLFCKIAES